jgi:hypothetical protein
MGEVRANDFDWARKKIERQDELSLIPTPSKPQTLDTNLIMAWVKEEVDLAIECHRNFFEEFFPFVDAWHTSNITPETIARLREDKGLILFEVDKSRLPTRWHFYFDRNLIKSDV